MIYDETFALSSSYFSGNEECRYIADDHEDDYKLYFRNISVNSYDFQAEFSYKHGSLKLIGLDGTTCNDMSEAELVILKECLAHLFEIIYIESALHGVLRAYLNVDMDTCSTHGCRSPDDDVRERYSYPLCYSCRIQKDNDDFLKKYPYG